MLGFRPPIYFQSPEPTVTQEILEQTAKVWHFAIGCDFPLAKVPERSYKDSGSGFGTPRPKMGPGILHPACDLEAPVGTEVLAVDDGIVVAGPYDFYLGTVAIEVQHRFFVVRYGELKVGPGPRSPFVKRGDVLGKVGKVGKGNMLHLEMFSGAANGRLSIKKPPWNRRSDLLDPTPFLDLWAMKV